MNTEAIGVAGARQTAREAAAWRDEVFQPLLVRGIDVGR